MASKLAAIFFRGTRGVGEAVYEEKGRDIYDLLWYMNKKVVPDFDYLMAKGIDAKDPRALFDKLTLQMNKVNDKNLEQDLEPLFVDKTYIKNWLKNWRESYLRLLDEYKIRTVTKLANIEVHPDSLRDTYHFMYRYETKEDDIVSVVYKISDHWIDLPSGDLSIEAENRIEKYKKLFLEKTEKYFKKTNGVMLGDAIITKVIRMTADNLNQKEQVVLNKSALLSCELDDLLK